MDPGVGSYFARPGLREAFRGTGFHATVLVDGRDSSEVGGLFLWTRHAVARVLVADVERGVVVAEHDGYRRLEDPVSHRRAVLAVGDSESILVVDRMEARGRHEYRQRWPLHPALELDEICSDRFIAKGRKAGMLVAISSSRSLSLSAVRGNDDPLEGWWSERLESAVPSWLVTAELSGSDAVEVATLLAPFELDEVPEAGIELSARASGTFVELTGVAGGCVAEVDLSSRIPRVRWGATSAV